MHVSRLTIAAAATLTIAFAAATSAQAATAPPMMTLTQHQVMSAVRQYADAFNAGNVTAAVSMCTSPAAIIDELSPHQWQGASACADWARDLAAANRAAGITASKVTLGIPWQDTVDGSSAYVVLPVTYAYKQHGTPMVETGSIWTFALRKAGSDWRISGWTWSSRLSS